MQSEPLHFAPHSRRRRLIVLVSAAVTLTAAEWTVRHCSGLLRLYDNNLYARKLTALERAGRTDILLIGSSRVRYGLVPDVFRDVTGMQAFNLGVSNAKAVEWRLLARRALATCKPRLVVLGVNAGELRGNYEPLDAVKTLFDCHELWRYTRDHGWDGEIVGAYLRARVGSACATFDRRFPIRLAIQDALGAWGLKTSDLPSDIRSEVARPLSADGNDHPWPKNPARHNFAESLRHAARGDRGTPPPQFNPRTAAFAEFDGLLDEFARTGVPLLVVYLPNGPSLEAHWEQAETAMRAQIAQACHRHATPYMEFESRDPPRSNADFADDVHAGQQLARVFSHRIAERIVALGLLDGTGPRLAEAPKRDEAVEARRQ